MSAPVLLLSLHTLLVCVAFLFFGYKLWLLLTDRREPLRQLRTRTRWADSVLLGTILLSGLSLWATASTLGPGFLSLLLGVVALLLACVWALRRQSAYLAFGDLLGAVVLYSATLYCMLPNVLPGQLRQLETTTLPSAAGVAEAAATPDAAPPVDTTAVVATSGTLAAGPDGSVATPTGAGADAASPPADPVAVAAAASEPAEAGVAGKALYAQYCTPCHGADGRKGLGGAYDLTKSNLNATGRVYQITNGSLSKKMPAFKGQLTEQQIQAVADYSLTLK